MTIHKVGSNMRRRLISSQYLKYSSYERVANSLLRNQPKAKLFGRVRHDRLITGTLSLHRTSAAHMWRTFWRIKFYILKLHEKN